MIPGAFEHTWYIPSAGFVWRNYSRTSDPNDLNDGRNLGEDPRAESGQNPKRVDPLELDRQLFRQFAQILPDKDNVLRFANQYGQLGVHSRVKRRSGRSKGRETLDDWFQEIMAMWHVVTLWDACQANDLDTLAKFIQWDGEGVQVHFRAPLWHNESPPPMLISGNVDGSDLPGQLRAPDLVLPAAVYVWERVSHRLGKPGSWTALVWQREHKHGGDNMRLNFHTLAYTLCQELWQQAAAAVGGGTPLKRCYDNACGRWFPIPPMAPLGRSQFCSDTCRVRTHRERQDQARRMWTAGKTFEEIALAVRSSVPTVKYWVTGQREERRDG